MSYDTKEKRVFSCDTKEENMDSTDSALDEIVSSVLYECLYKIFNKCWIFFHLLGNLTY